MPSFTISLVIFLVAGFFVPATANIDTTAFTSALASKFNLSLWLLLVPLFTGWMIYKKLPAIIVLFASSVIAIIFAVIFQPHILVEISGMQDVSAEALLKGALQSGFGKTAVDSGFVPVNELLATRGMAGMLNSVWIILCAICFGGVLKASGMLANIVELIVPLTKTRVGLVASGLLRYLLQCYCRRSVPLYHAQCQYVRGDL